MTARGYDFGAIAIALRVDASGLAWDAFVDRCNALDRAIGAASGSPLWRDALRSVLDVIGPALRRPATQHLEEDYLFAVVRGFGQPMTGQQIRSRVDLAALLSGERQPLSTQEVNELTRQSFSYLEDDLVVLTWDRAFIFEPRGESDVIDIIEVANAQLLEMRYYDELLDDELSTMYDLVEGARGGCRCCLPARRAAGAPPLWPRGGSHPAHRAGGELLAGHRRRLPRTHLWRRLELFRVPRLSAAVDRKLAIIRDTYGALYEEASSRRAELLELAIVLLIVFEILLALTKP